MSSSSSSSLSQSQELTAEQLAQIERNRQKALLRQQKKQRNLTTDEIFKLETYNALKVSSSQDRDGGFFVKQDEPSNLSQLSGNQISSSKIDSVVIKNDTKENVCDECEDNFSNSFLLSNFGEKICDFCKDLKTKHCLITKTEAKQEYLLSDVDLSKREPPLRCLLKKNPHKFARGQMQLFLRLQVEERALEVWGSEERLEEERKNRDFQRESRKRKQFDKQMKDLRMNARSSLYKKSLHQTHEHCFGEEKLVENVDDSEIECYQQICQTCGFKKIYEKL
ncbi:alpha-1D adrenergic receptor-like [Sarcoptes scabiei]|uniref:DNA repair protein complementing XP-A cells-like protein n=1 Tax=Sarcoptes scabiei TaxID=52283 RepID=A0A131ZXQ2_SARSC|nr:DNA repair protein complementing XP-A cells-like protein [Sarcoptes scabiei]UXI20967.1 alpha-1D adrenergic receptor-like [Sarcoptes scabiei]